MLMKVGFVMSMAYEKNLFNTKQEEQKFHSEGRLKLNSCNETKSQAKSILHVQRPKL